jgi:hypothetical protein
VLRNVKHARLNNVQVFDQIGKDISIQNCRDVMRDGIRVNDP